MTHFGPSKFIGATALLLASTAIAQAGGLDRTGLGIAPIFEDGTYAELSFSLVNPTISGVFPGNGSSSGDMASSFSTMGLAYKQDLSDAVSVALIFETAFGAAVDYTNSDPTYPITAPPLAGPGQFNAELAGNAITAMARYDFGNGFSMHGGLRASWASRGRWTCSTAPAAARRATRWMPRHRPRSATCWAPPMSARTSRCAWP
jgi:long-chain fatty acid transport protein